MKAWQQYRMSLIVFPDFLTLHNQKLIDCTCHHMKNNIKPKNRRENKQTWGIRPNPCKEKQKTKKLLRVTSTTTLGV